jgi:hypothetical protein
VNVHAQLVKSLIQKMEANAFQSVIQWEDKFLILD